MKGAHQPNDVPSTSGVRKWFLCMLWESFSLIWSCPKNLYLFWFFRGFLVTSKVLWGYFPTALNSSLWLVWSKVRGRRVFTILFFHCRLVFRGTLSYGLNQQLNQESDINKKGKILDLVGKVAWLESYRIVKNKLTNGLDLWKRFFKSLIRCCEVKLQMAYGSPSDHLYREVQIYL